MNFQYTETQILVADTVASVVADHVEKGRGGTAGDAAAPLWGKLAELGLLGAEIEEAAGGSGGSFEDLALILQGLGRGAAAGAFVPAIVVGAGLISRLGDDEQRRTLLPAIAEGRLQAVLAHHETSDLTPGQPVTARATPVEGGWTLRGEKAFILGGDVADIFIVSAETDRGLSLFLVPSDASGVAARGIRLFDGGGGAHLTLNNCFVPQTALLGVDGEAAAAVEWALDRANAAFVNEAIGLMAELCDLTLNHIKTREQFGQVLGKFQVIQHGMVNMRIELELARSMAILAAVAADDPDETRRARDVSAAKAAVSKAARLVGQSAIQLHGAIAMTQEYPAGSYVKRLTLIERAFGDAVWHLARFSKLVA